MGEVVSFRRMPGADPDGILRGATMKGAMESTPSGINLAHRFLHVIFTRARYVERPRHSTGRNARTPGRWV